MTFGERIKTLRKEKKYTQQQFAEILGVAKSVVSYYESGDRFPSNDVLIRIAQHFHVSIDFLLGISAKRTLDVSDLSEADISVLETVADALRNKEKK